MSLIAGKNARPNLDFLNDWNLDFAPPEPPLPEGVEYRKIPFSNAVATDGGEIWSLYRGWKSLKQTINRDGYLQVKWKMRPECPLELRRLFPNNLPVHRLVLYAWAGFPQPGQECRHGLGGKLDNSPGNLQWGTAKENQWDNIERGIYKLRPEDVVAIRSLWGKKTDEELAEEFGVSKHTIYSVGSGRSWRIIG